MTLGTQVAELDTGHSGGRPRKAELASIIDTGPLAGLVAGPGVS